MSSRKSVPDPQKKILYGESGSRCAMCKTKVVKTNEKGSKYQIGVMAHIKGYGKSSARHDPDLTPEQKNKSENLILLCPNCHEEIDTNREDNSVEELQKIKEEHQEWVQDQLKQGMNNVNFAELEVILKHLSNISMDPEENYEVIPPKEKIEKNNLSSKVENLLRLGLIQVNEVKDFINQHPDTDYSERLRNGFVSQYEELKKEGYSDDALFYEMLDFAGNSSGDFNSKAAGLAVLTYFFEQCEVFEK